MGSTPINTFSAQRLIPDMRADKAIRLSVALAQGTYVAGQVLGEVTATPGTYGAYAPAAVATPAVAPTMGAAAGADGTIPAGTYYFGYTYKTANGETALSPISTGVAVGATNHVPTPVLTLPTGVTGVNWYMTDLTGGDAEMQLVASPSTGASINILAQPAPNAARPPRADTAVIAIDGTQNPRGLLEYACTVDASGNITSTGEWGQTRKNAPMFIGGGAVWKSQDVTGLDLAGLTAMGGALVEGNLTTGLFVF